MAKFRAGIVPVTLFQLNCTLLWSEASKLGAVIDPGGDLETIVDAIGQTGIAVEKILLTHGHIAHAGGAAELKERLGVPIEGPHRADLPLLERDEVTIGDLTFAVLHCPGHSPGSVVFVSAAERFAIVGDVLFKGSIGRTDLPGGDHAALIAAIKTKLLPLGDDVAFICGHGPPSTIGEERATNPFLR
jgi:glyoxylase-like metal-dependent hydrolase (beta-lactamase superfamily II)